MPIDIALRNDAQVITNDRGNYWRYYGLHCDPFSPGMLTNEIYAVPRWEEYCDLLHYLCHSSNALLLVTGIKSSGKTTFMHQFMTQIDEASRVCQLLGTPAVDVEQITAAMVKQFAVLPPHGENLEEQSESLAINLQQCTYPCVLIIDDAHRLNINALQMLLYLVKQQSEAQMRLHILLLGTPELNQAFARLAAADDERELVHHLGLESLTLEETHRYIKHRLAVAGLPAAMPLSQATINRIYNLSEGVLGRINVVARQALIDGMRQPQLHAAVDFLRAYQTQFLGGGILLIVLICMAIMLARGSQVPHFSLPKLHFSSLENIVPKLTAAQKTMVVSKTELVKQQVQQSIVAVKEKPRPVNIPTIVSREPEQSKNNDVAAMPPAFDLTPSRKLESEVVKPATIATQAVLAKTLNTKTITTTPTTAAQPVSNSITPQASVLVTTSTPATTAQPSVRNAVVASLQPAFDFTPKQTTQPPAEVETIAAAPAVSTIKPVVKSTVAPVKKNTAVKKTDHQLTSGSLLKAIPQHFTIQLIGLSTEQSMQGFIADNNLSHGATVIHTKRASGKDWYTLVRGEYETMQQAQMAIQKLPQSLQEQHPWVRKMSSVQQAIKQSPKA